MRLQGHLLSVIAEAAELSPQETECLRLWCGQGLDGEELAQKLHVKKGAAAVIKCHVRRKIRQAQATYEALVLRRQHEHEDRYDASDLARRGGFLGFILECMSPPPHAEPSRQLLGVTWTEVFDDVDNLMCLTGAVHAGPLVSPDGEHRGLSAAQNREKIAAHNACLLKNPALS